MARYAPLTFDAAVAAPAKTKSSPGFGRRIYDALVRARTRQAEREVARYLEMHGKLTDNVEREIERRVTGYPAAANRGGWL